MGAGELDGGSIWGAPHNFIRAPTGHNACPACQI